MFTQVWSFFWTRLSDWFKTVVWQARNYEMLTLSAVISAGLGVIGMTLVKVCHGGDWVRLGVLVIIATLSVWVGLATIIAEEWRFLYAEDKVVVALSSVIGGCLMAWGVLYICG